MPHYSESRVFFPDPAHVPQKRDVKKSDILSFKDMIEAQKDQSHYWKKTDLGTYTQDSNEIEPGTKDMDSYSHIKLSFLFEQFVLTIL